MIPSMKLLLSLVLLAAAALQAQTVTEAMAADKLALTNSTNVTTITASQGDGGSCSITKISGGQIIFTWSCASADGKQTLRPGPIQSLSTTASSVGMLFGDILCLIGINPTSTAVSMGSIGSVPAKGIGWTCTTSITGGGSTVPTGGTVIWP